MEEFRGEHKDLNETLKQRVVVAEYVSIVAALICCLTSVFLAFDFESSAALALFTGNLKSLLD